MNIWTLLIITLLLVVVSALPTWPHAQTWGWGPSGGVGVLLLVVIVLLLAGVLPR